MSAATPIPAAVDVRATPAVQRAYFYLVGLVAIHMIVLGAANLLRVGAEVALGAPSGGFTGLPFVFNEFNRPSAVYREHASLAIALLAVGVPAWAIHFRAAQNAALRSPEERASALRSMYLHVVILVAALLVFAYTQRTLRLVLQGTTFGAAGASQAGFFLEPYWEARAAGAACMALSALAVLVLHVRLSIQDRAATLIGGRAAELRQLAFYTLVVVGLFYAAFSTAFTLNGLWDRLVADSIAPFPPPPQPPARTIVTYTPPDRDALLRFQLLGQLPPIVTGLALWLGTWTWLGRGLRAHTHDGEVERRSIARKLAIYLIVFVSALNVLFAATSGLAATLRRALGDPVTAQYESLVRDLGFPVAFTIVFSTVWLFHRRVVDVEAARETELERAATIRRLYTYLIAAIGLAMSAFGMAGAIGVVGSQLMGMNTHPNGETATYLALVLVGVPAWGFHWWQARRRLDDHERRSLPRRGYLYLAALGGILGVLVFGSAALYRLLNAILAGSFPLATWHDLWHFTVDAAVSGSAFAFHVGILRADRRAELPESSVHTLKVLVRGGDAASARARLIEALRDQSDISVR